jgi:Mrp family chromosome partitioning ATPase
MPVWFLLRQVCTKGCFDMVDQAPDLVQRAAARLQQKAATRKLEVAPVLAASAPNVTRIPDPSPIDLVAVQAAAKPAPAAPGSGIRRRSVVVSPTSLAAHGVALPAGGVSRTVEEFRALKRHVLANALRDCVTPDAEATRIVLVTSARPGDGKTFTATNLAFALAFERDVRVLLMDADAYRQSVMVYLGISADTGWLDIVAGGSAAASESVLATSVPGLSVLPAGKERAEIPELISSRRMKTLLDDLVREDPQRFIIIDGLPCLTSTEPSLLAALAGQTLFVVAAHQTSREDIESSLRLLNASPSVNLVLNKTEPLLSEQFKGYGYAYAQQR